MLAYRSLHADGSGWGCNHRAIAKTVRRGFSTGIFKRALRELTAAGLLDREQGRRRGPGRGRGYAIDRLTFERPASGYVVVERDLFDGRLAVSEIAAVLFIRARDAFLAAPWQIRARLGVSAPTARAILAALRDAGIIENHGTPLAQTWGLTGAGPLTSKNPTRKKSTRKKPTRKKPTRTRKPTTPRTISPPHLGEPRATHGQSEKTIHLTDKNSHRERREAVGVIAEIKRGISIQPRVGGHGQWTRAASDDADERIPISAASAATIERLGGNVDALYARALAQIARGRRIADMPAYLVAAAKNAAADRAGVPVASLAAIASNNPWARAAAHGAAVGAPAEIAPRILASVTRRLTAAGLDPCCELTAWRTIVAASPPKNASAHLDFWASRRARAARSRGQ